MSVERRIKDKIEKYRERFSAGGRVPVFNITGEWHNGIILSGFDESGKKSDIRLGNTEFDILFLISSVGISASYIAIELSISEYTVRNQLKDLYRKFSLKEGIKEGIKEHHLPHILIERGFLKYEP